MTHSRPEVLSGYTCKTESPEGTVFVTINEDKSGKAIEVQIYIGKGGTILSAWADALARVISLALRSETDINAVLCEVSGITSSRIKRLASGSVIRSGPEAVAYAIMAYLRQKHEQTIKRFKIGDDDELENGRID